MGTKREEKPQVDEVFARPRRVQPSIGGVFTRRGIVFKGQRRWVEAVGSIPDMIVQ